MKGKPACLLSRMLQELLKLALDFLGENEKPGMRKRSCPCKPAALIRGFRHWLALHPARVRNLIGRKEARWGYRV